MNIAWIEIEKNMHEMAKPYIAEREKWMEHYSGLVRHKKFAKGGLLIPWGFFCPSFAYDRIVGNARRGKLYKRVPENVIPDYEYGFDENENLITIAQKAVNDTKVFIVRSGNSQLGIQYDDLSDLVNSYVLCYSEFVDGQISLFCVCEYSQKELLTCWYEKYRYKNKVLDELDLIEVGAHRGNYSIKETYYHWNPDIDKFVLKH